MSRLIFVPQYPSKMRYQEFFYNEFPKEFSKYYDEVITIGESYVKSKVNNETGLFAPRKESINFEFCQINEYLNLKLEEDDTLLFMDISYPGFFANVLYHKPINAYCYCHATSKNSFDIFDSIKFSCETAHSKLFKKVFVGSKYHQNKLGWNNTKVVGLPFPPFETFREKKEYEIISVARPNPQKVTKVIEDWVERDFSKIVRKECKTWEEYYKFLSSGKILLITTKEETFGYSTKESIMNGTVVLAPNKFSYPELLPKEYLYDDYDDLCMKIWAVLHDDLEPPEKLLCNDLCENFYENVVNEMKVEQ
jgi:hypothetical protein